MSAFPSGQPSPVIARQRNPALVFVSALGFGFVLGVILWATLGTPVSMTSGAGDGSSSSQTIPPSLTDGGESLAGPVATIAAYLVAPTATATATSTPLPTATPQPTMPTLAERYGICDADTPAGATCYQVATRIETPVPYPDCELGGDWAGLCVAKGDESAHGGSETR